MRLRSLLFFALTLLLFLGSCSEKETTQDIKPFECLEGDKQKLVAMLGNQKNFLNTSPLDYLGYLSCVSENQTVSIVLITFDVESNWVTKEDVAKLMPYIESTQPARKPWLNGMEKPKSTSTIGIEAMHLVEIYKNKNFNYPYTESEGYCTKEQQLIRAQQLHDWWMDYK